MNFDNDEQLHMAKTQILGLIAEATTDPATVKRFLTTFSRADLVKYQSIADSTKAQHKHRCLHNIIFKDIINTLRKKEKSIKTLDGMMEASVKIAFASAYTNSSGEMMWGGLKDDVNERIKQIDKAEGAAEALAQRPADVMESPRGLVSRLFG
eukprot:UN0047